MEISRFDDAEAFLRHAGPFLRTHAIDNNVMLGIAGRLVDAPWDDAVMVTVDDGGTPCLAGLMTPPWRSTSMAKIHRHSYNSRVKSNDGWTRFRDCCLCKRIWTKAVRNFRSS